MPAPLIVILTVFPFADSGAGTIEIIKRLSPTADIAFMARPAE
jgi:hypothetical protein